MNAKIQNTCDPYKFSIHALLKEGLLKRKALSGITVNIDENFEFESGKLELRSIGIIALSQSLLGIDRNECMKMIIQNIAKAYLKKSDNLLQKRLAKHKEEMVKALTNSLSNKQDDMVNGLIILTELPQASEFVSPLQIVAKIPGTKITLKNTAAPIEFIIIFYAALSIICYPYGGEKINAGIRRLLLQLESLTSADIPEEIHKLYDYKFINTLLASLLMVQAENQYAYSDYKNACTSYTKIILNSTNADGDMLKESRLIYSLQRRSSCLYHLKRYHESINDCEKLADSEDYRVYQTMAASLAKIDRSRPAIVNYKKSLKLKDHWLTYELLGIEYSKINEEVNALYCFKQSILNSLGQSNFSQRLANNIDRIKACISQFNNKRPIDVSRKFLRNSPIQTFDPVCGGQYYRTNDALFAAKKNSFHEEGYDFIPSILELSEISGSIWKDIVFIHIPKCRGTSFQLPLQRSYDAAIEINKQSNFKGVSKLFSYGNIHDSYVLSKIQSAFLHDGRKPPNSIFCSPHGCNWESLIDSIELKKIDSPLTLTILRDPAERLMSNIKHYMYYSSNIEEFREKVKNEFYNFDNCLYRYLVSDFSRDCEKSQDDQAINSQMRGVVDRMMCFSMSDDLSLNKIKSLYLSQARLPNVLHWSRLKDSQDRETSEPSRWSNEDLLSEYSRIVDNGGLELDCKINTSSLVDSTTKKFSDAIALNEKFSNFSLHPFTLIIDKNSCYKLVETKSLFD